MSNPPSCLFLGTSGIDHSRSETLAFIRVATERVICGACRPQGGDELTPDSRCKPAGVAGVQLFCRIGEAPSPAAPLSSDFMDLITRGSRIIHFKQEDVGKRAYYFGRWQTAAGRVGPWSLVASRMIAE